MFPSYYVELSFVSIGETCVYENPASIGNYAGKKGIELMNKVKEKIPFGLHVLQGDDICLNTDQ